MNGQQKPFSENPINFTSTLLESCEVAAEDPGRPAGDESSLDDG